MSNKIPTAQKFLEREIALKYPEGKGLHIASILIEFAKLHVKAALEAAAKSAYAEESRIGYVWEVNEDSILKAYPDDFIK
jgi:hypothetical protein